MKTRITFSLDTARDADLLAWLGCQQAGARSAAIRDTLRAGLGLADHEPSLADILAAIHDLRSNFCPAERPFSTLPPTEPPDVAAALDNLGM